MRRHIHKPTKCVHPYAHTEYVDSDPYHKAWLFNPKLHQKLMVKGVSLSWVPSSGTLFPPGYGLCQTYHHLRNIWRLTFISNNSQYLQSSMNLPLFSTSWKRLEAVGILRYINMWHYYYIRMDCTCIWYSRTGNSSSAVGPNCFLTAEYRIAMVIAVFIA